MGKQTDEDLITSRSERQWMKTTDWCCRVCSILAKEADDRRLLLDGLRAPIIEMPDHMHRWNAVAARQVDICAAADEFCHTFEIMVPACPVEQGSSILRERVEISAMVKEQSQVGCKLSHIHLVAIGQERIRIDSFVQ